MIKINWRLNKWRASLWNKFSSLCYADIPEDALNDESEDEDKRNPDERISSEYRNFSERRKRRRVNLKTTYASAEHFSWFSCRTVVLSGWNCICRVLRLVLFFTVRASDKRISCDEEFSDSEDEGEGGRRNRESFKHRKRLKVSENGEKKDADDKGETPRSLTLGPTYNK